MSNIEKKELKTGQLDKVSGGLYKLPDKKPTYGIPYEAYVGTTIRYNGRNCEVVSAFERTDDGVVGYFYTLKYTDGTTQTVDKATFETIIADSPVSL